MVLRNSVVCAIVYESMMNTYPRSVVGSLGLHIKGKEIIPGSRIGLTGCFEDSGHEGRPDPICNVDEDQ